MKIRSLMRPRPIVVSDTSTLGNAQRLMTTHHIRHLPVIGAGMLVGMLSERDLLAARARAEEVAWWSIVVREAMQPAPATASPDDTVTEVAARMAQSKLDAFPVLERGKLVGIVTVIDVLDAEAREAIAAPGPATASSPAAAVMRPNPPTVHPEQPLFDAIEVMFDHHMRDLPVVDGSGKVVGLLSEGDVRDVIGDPAHYLGTSTRRRFDVQDVMDRSVPAVPATRPLVELAHYFADQRLDAIPVVDAAGKLVGIVSYLEALHALAR